ncbi:hypothetical protein VZT92_002125 [Zoarces viviparus]|uniref:Uncharacterized protein n=1 Tax=Zoarces viviparus TaxID=48416 RepID=A0AAW1G2X2_ZOAVI
MRCISVPHCPVSKQQCLKDAGAGETRGVGAEEEARGKIRIIKRSDFKMEEVETENRAEHVKAAGSEGFLKRKDKMRGNKLQVQQRDERR